MQIKDYCQFIIVEGVEQETYFQFAKPYAAAFQGYLFDAINFEALG